jgi:hypothetical protein
MKWILVDWKRISEFSDTYHFPSQIAETWNCPTITMSAVDVCHLRIEKGSEMCDWIMTPSCKYSNKGTFGFIWMLQSNLRFLEAIWTGATAKSCLSYFRGLQSLIKNGILRRNEWFNILNDIVVHIDERQMKCEQEYDELVGRWSESKACRNTIRHKKESQIPEKAQESKLLTSVLCKRLCQTLNASKTVIKIQNPCSNRITILESFRTDEWQLTDNASFVPNAFMSKEANETAIEKWRYDLLAQVRASIRWAINDWIQEKMHQSQNMTRK